MALDAKITKVTTHLTRCNIELEAREPKDGPAGQSAMEILNPKYIPEVGDLIWGNANRAEIVSLTGEVKARYQRVGYTTLREEE